MEMLRKSAVKKVLKEFKNFKRKMIYRLSKRELWERCNKIHFCICVREYFELNERIPKVYLELVMAQPMFLEWLWSSYLKREGNGYQTWEEIEALLDAGLMEWNQPIAG